MIYLLAGNLEDARQWAHRNGLARGEVVYVGQSWNLPRTMYDERDRVARTERAAEHPEHAALERMLEHTLTSCGLTETLHGRLVRRQG